MASRRPVRQTKKNFQFYIPSHLQKTPCPWVFLFFILKMNAYFAWRRGAANPVLVKSSSQQEGIDL